MTLIRLTEYTRGKGDEGIVEKPILINPEGIGTVSEGTMDKESIPIIGSNDRVTHMRLITMRNNQKLAVKESLEEIASKCNDTGN